MGRKQTCLITHYWYPYNSSGTFRWLKMSEFFNFDLVITSKQPRRGFKDLTVPTGKAKKIIRFGKKWPAFLWGWLVYFKIRKLKGRFIFTSPPEALLIPAWLMQRAGNEVVVDFRDSMYRRNKKIQWLNSFYQKLYNQLTIIVCARFIDTSKPVVYHGADLIKLNVDAFKTNPLVLTPTSRLSYAEYYRRLEKSIIPSFALKPRNYNSSSLATVRRMGFTPRQVNANHLHEEIQKFNPLSWKTRAKQFKKIVGWN